VSQFCYILKKKQNKKQKTKIFFVFSHISRIYAFSSFFLF